MRKLVTTLSFVLLLQAVHAQKTTKSSSDFSPSYGVKINPVNLFFGSLGVQGEYNFKNKKSLTFGIGIPVETTNSWLEIDDEKRDLKLKTFYVMAGYRMYMGKKSMSGVYFEPYLHYTKNEAATTIEEDIDGMPTTFLVNSNYKAYGLGAQLGVQFHIANRVTFDFFFLGPEANIADQKMVMKDTNPLTTWDDLDAADAEAEIKDFVRDIPIIGEKINVAVDKNQKTVTTDYKGFLPGFRIGLSVGVRF